MSGSWRIDNVTDGQAAPAATSARAAAHKYADATRSLGLAPDEALALVRQALGS